MTDKEFWDISFQENQTALAAHHQQDTDLPDEAQPLLQEIRAKLIESGYKCRKFTNSNDGFVARCGKSFARVWLKFDSGKTGITWYFYCDPSDPLHQLGIDYLIESAIVNFRFNP